jgi:hypothetical protein
MLRRNFPRIVFIVRVEQRLRGCPPPGAEALRPLLVGAKLNERSDLKSILKNLRLTMSRS